jgi:hypothetical protein
MERAENRARKHLQVERESESSRLEGQVIAAAYELVTPLICRTLSPAAADRVNPRQTRGAERQQRPARRHA